MSFWQKLKLIGSQIFSFLLPFIKRFLTDSGKWALNQAMIYVPIIAATFAGADGETKRKEVFKMIMAEAKTKGIELSTSLVNSAIEAAVAKMKEA